MATIKRRKRNHNKPNANLPVPFEEEPKKIEDGENAENITAIEEYKTQPIIKPIIKPIFIPEETLFVEDGRFEKIRIILEVIVTFVGLSTLWWFIHSSGTQHDDSIRSLNLAKETFRISDSLRNISDSLQRIKDSATLAIAVQSNSFTRKSVENYEKLTKVDLRAYVVIDKVQKLKFVSKE